MDNESTTKSLELIPPGTIYITKVNGAVDQTTSMFTSITVHQVIETGSFGLVYAARLSKTQRLVALKQVLHDPQDREVDILNRLRDHCNIVQLYVNFHVFLGEQNEKYSLLALDHLPMSLTDYMFQQQHRFMPWPYVRIIAYQLFRGLAFVHSHGICHRDIKPDNLLIDPLTMNLRIGNFANGIFLGQPQVSVINSGESSRLYQAPEVFGTFAIYSNAMDIWSAGCVLAEIINSTTLFEHFVSDEKQLLNIILVLGTFGLDQAPRLRDASGITKVIVETRADWPLLLGTEVPEDLQQLLNLCLLYDAAARITPLAACASASFDELRTMELMKTPMPNGVALPPLFNFSSHEMNIDKQLSLLLLPLQFEEQEQET